MTIDSEAIGPKRFTVPGVLFFSISKEFLTGTLSIQVEPSLSTSEGDGLRSQSAGCLYFCRVVFIQLMDSLYKLGKAQKALIFSVPKPPLKASHHQMSSTSIQRLHDHNSHSLTST